MENTASKEMDWAFFGLYLIQNGGLELYMIQTPEDLENTSVSTIILLTFGYERLKMGVDQIRLVPISRTPVGVISQVPRRNG